MDNLSLICTAIYYYYYLWGGTKSLGTAATSGLLYKPQMINEDDCGAIGGMKIGRENRSTRRKPAPAPLCPPQIPHEQTRDRTPGRSGGKPAINCLSYGAAIYVRLYNIFNVFTTDCFLLNNINISDLLCHKATFYFLLYDVFLLINRP
jgi:hypothetical protein